MPSRNSRAEVVGQAGVVSVTQLTEEPLQPNDDRVRVKAGGRFTRSQTIMMVKLLSVLATAGLLLFTLTRSGDARHGVKGQGGEGLQAAEETALTAEAQQRLVEEGKQIFRFDTFGDE